MRQIDHAVGKGKASGSFVMPVHMCHRFIIDPYVKGEEAAAWSGLRSWIFLFQGNLLQAERQALRHRAHWISAAILEYIASGSAGDREATRLAWSPISAKIRKSARPAKSLPEEESIVVQQKAYDEEPLLEIL